MGRKIKWYPRVLALLESEGDEEKLTWNRLLDKLKCSKSDLSRSIDMGKRENCIVRKINPNDEIVYVLSPSGEQQRLKASTADALNAISVYPLETVATSYASLNARLEDDFIVDSSMLEHINIILQQQYSREINSYSKAEQLKLVGALIKAALDGLNYCLEHNVAGLEKKIRNQIAGHPEKIFQVMQTNLALFLEYGLKDLAPSFVYQESHLRLLAAELERIFAEISLSTMDLSNQMKESVKFLHRNDSLLRDFLDRLGKIRFLLVVPFGFPTLEKNSAISAEGAMQSFDLWIKRLQEGIVDPHAWFLFKYGARNLLRFIKVLGDPSLKMKSLYSKEKIIKERYLPSRILKPRKSEKDLSEIEECLRFAVDLREPWDLMFLYRNHSRGKQPEFYSDILSLVVEIRNKAKLEPHFTIPEKQKSVRTVVLTKEGFLIYYEGQEQPEIIGPNDNTKVT